MEDSPPRAHGFQRPFHPFQVVSWVVFGTDVLLYLTCILSLVDHSVKLLLAPWYILTVIVLVGATAQATRCNAADRHVRFDDSALQEEEDDELPFCGFCNVSVFPRSKHCRICCKCVDVFDHHCMWINNCVGRANYFSFFITIASVSLMIGTVLCTCAYLLIAYFADEDAFEKRLLDTPVLCELSREFMLVLIILMSLLNLPLFVLDCQLVVLHIFLMTQGLTTYEYIMNKRDALERTDGSADEEASPDKPETPKKGPQRKGAVRLLPRCMDWIIFCNCGRRRRKRHSPDRSGEGRDRACSSDNAPLAVQMGHPCNEDNFSPASSSSKGDQGTRTPLSPLEIPSSPELNHHSHNLSKIGLPKEAVIARGQSKEPLPPLARADNGRAQAQGPGPGRAPGPGQCQGQGQGQGHGQGVGASGIELEVAAEAKLETRTLHCNLTKQQDPQALAQVQGRALQSLDEGSQSSLSQEMVFAAEIDGMAAGSSLSSCGAENDDDNKHSNNSKHSNNGSGDAVDETFARVRGQEQEKERQEEREHGRERETSDKETEKEKDKPNQQPRDEVPSERSEERKEERTAGTAKAGTGAGFRAGAGAGATPDTFAPPGRATSSSASRRSKRKEEADSIWQVGQCITTPTRISLWEGPERTSLEVGVVQAGSSIVVHEVHHGAHASMRCAFVSIVTDAASSASSGAALLNAGGQQGWIRCDSVVVRRGDAPIEDSSSSSGSSSSHASGSLGADGASGKENGTSKPLKKKRQPSSGRKRSKHGCNLNEALISTSPEDRTFDELPSPDREYPCLTCSCGTAGRGSITTAKGGGGTQGPTELEMMESRGAGREGRNIGLEAPKATGRSSPPPRPHDQTSQEKQQLLLPLQSNHSLSMHLPLQPGAGQPNNNNNNNNNGSSSGAAAPQSPRHQPHKPPAPAATGAAGAAGAKGPGAPGAIGASPSSTSQQPSSASGASASGASASASAALGNSGKSSSHGPTSNSHANSHASSHLERSSPSPAGRPLHVDAPLHSAAAGLQTVPAAHCEPESE